MLIPVYKNRFEKDVKQLKKRGKDLSKLKIVIDELTQGNALNRKYFDHALKGQFVDCRECHIEPDWLLIYLIESPYITFVRTGTHSDLF
jgi:mRNA interferase YafQ